MSEEHGDLPQEPSAGAEERTDEKTRHASRVTRHFPYRVRLDLFEGPLDLLLHLIKKNEVAVTDIPVAAITEQYLAYLDLLRELNLDVAGEYLVMAATLTLIKSRTLLPAAPGEEEAEEDPRADLVRQLLEYQRFREAAQALGASRLLGRDVFAREPNAEGLETGEGRVAVRATMWELIEAFRAVLDRARAEPIQELAAEPVSLRERVEVLLKTLSVARSITFDSLFDDRSSRAQIIVTFLALLELMKMGAVEAVQEERCGSILIVLAVEDVAAVSLDLEDEYDGDTVAVEG
jgi:segregation and condensation protein A